MPFLGVLTNSSRSGLRPKWSWFPLQPRVVPGSDGSVAKGVLEIGGLLLISRTTSLMLFGSSRMAGNGQRGALLRPHLGSKMFRVFRCLLGKQRNSLSRFLLCSAVCVFRNS